MACESWAGLPGSGKTMSLIRRVTLDYRRKRQSKKLEERLVTVWSDIASFKVPGAIYISLFDDIVRAKLGIIVLDEAGIIMSARGFQKLPPEMMWMLLQHRHLGLDLYYTAQDWEGVDKALRTVTLYVHHCHYAKIINLFWNRLTTMSCKDSIGWEFHFFDKQIADLYSTLELIGNPFTGKGRGAVVGAAPPTHSSSTPLPGNRVFSGFYGYEKNHQLTPTQKYIKQWLSFLGMTDWRTKNYVKFFQTEYERFQWLRLFGLSLTDVPLSCTPETPWAIPPPASIHPQAEIFGQRSLPELNDSEAYEHVDRFWRPWSAEKLLEFRRAGLVNV